MCNRNQISTNLLSKFISVTDENGKSEDIVMFKSIENEVEEIDINVVKINQEIVGTLFS